MIRSRNELMAMTMKAARGAGVPLGLAEELTAAVAFLPTDALAAVVDALTVGVQPAELTWGDDHFAVGKAQALTCGPVAVDAIQCGVNTVEIEDLDSVPVLQAYLDAAHARGVHLAIAVGSEGAAVVRKGPAKEVSPTGPRAIPADIWAALNRFAQNTYVPETEASRLSGAGAGLTDND